MKINNIILIGMAGAGKSTIGKLLAKKLNFKFIDCDDYLEKKEGMISQQIIDIKGDEGFLKIEEKRNLELLPLEKHVLAPGGSIVYLEKVMSAFRASSVIIFLDLPLKIIKKRLTDKSTRGIVGLKSKSVEELYKERMPLYKKYADAIVNCYKKSNTKIVNEIIKKYKSF